MKQDEVLWIKYNLRRDNQIIDRNIRGCLIDDNILLIGRIEFIKENDILLDSGMMYKIKGISEIRGDYIFCRVEVEDSVNINVVNNNNVTNNVIIGKGNVQNNNYGESLNKEELIKIIQENFPIDDIEQEVLELIEKIGDADKDKSQDGSSILKKIKSKLEDTAWKSFENAIITALNNTINNKNVIDNVITWFSN